MVARPRPTWATRVPSRKARRRGLRAARQLHRRVLLGVLLRAAAQAPDEQVHRDDGHLVEEVEEEEVQREEDAEDAGHQGQQEDVVLLDPVGASWDTIGANHIACDVVCLLSMLESQKGRGQTRSVEERYENESKNNTRINSGEGEMKEHSIFYYPYASFRDDQVPLLKAAALYFDKLYILDPFKASWDMVGLAGGMKELSLLEQEGILERVAPEEVLKEYEEALGDPILWNAVVADRRIYLGKKATLEQDYSSRFDHERMLAIIQVGLEEMEDIWQAAKKK